MKYCGNNLKEMIFPLGGIGSGKLADEIGLWCDC